MGVEGVWDFHIESGTSATLDKVGLLFSVSGKHLLFFREYLLL